MYICIFFTKTIGMRIEKILSATNLNSSWDKLTESVYQSSDFLIHLEQNNPCCQRYYLLYNEDRLIAGAIVYSLKINLLTFSKFKLNLPFTIIGVPCSVDGNAIIGDEKYYNLLIEYILKEEKGIILCLNYDNPLKINGIIQMQTLPTIVFENNFNSWEDYLNELKHNYRRRVSQALRKYDGIIKTSEACNTFTDNHYSQYLSIMEKTKTKLEILSKDFFQNLNNNFVLHSLYKDENLLTWHITTKDNRNANLMYYFLFGGINYSLRDKYDSYFNNLISIIQEGIELKAKKISLGQTAEISKIRLGGELIPKRMFLYHSNRIINLLLYTFRNQLTNKSKSIQANIYKTH
jgi:hypothetical protein